MANEVTEELVNCPESPSGLFTHFSSHARNTTELEIVYWHRYIINNQPHNWLYRAHTPFYHRCRCAMCMEQLT